MTHIVVLLPIDAVASGYDETVEVLLMLFHVV